MQQLPGPSQFLCPTCNRIFRDWASCHTHATSRRHGLCEYDAMEVEPCVSDHIFRPVDNLSGWCDLQGRREYIEDYVSAPNGLEHTVPVTKCSISTL
jgi:hypothetical protein